MEKIHTFVICAYKKSPYLEACIRSVRNQEIKTEVILVTSTPNSYITGLCKKYHIPYWVNEGEHGITQDWNFAYSKCRTPVITIAHQDDIYFKNYTKTMLDAVGRAGRPLIFFSDYYELRNDKIVKENYLLTIKRILLFPLRIKAFQRSRFVRRRILSLGSSICCPSVAYCRDHLPEVVFQNHFRTDQDWEAWESISKLQGEFVYSTKALMAHRIHKDSETSAAIKENGRMTEDMEMFRKFWPERVAGFLARLYGKSQKSNDI